MASKAGLAFLDYSGEIGRCDFYMATSSAGNIAGQLDEINPVHAGSLTEAIAALSNCTLIQTDLLAATNKFTQTPPVSQFAQRELGLMVSYADNVTGVKYRITIPGPKWDTIGVAGTDNVDTGDALWTAFVALLQSQALSPLGNAVTVVSGRLVGRNR